MKLCYFNYMLQPNEKILKTVDCKVKSISLFDILDKKGVLLISDSRLVFCEIIGDHPHYVTAYEYKYISSIEIKKTDDMHLYIKYNGAPVKILASENDLKEILEVVLENK